MSTSHAQSSAVAAQAPAAAAPGPIPGGFRSDRTADRLMRRVLGITSVDRASGAGAHRTFRVSVFISAARCLITYVAIPVLVPILSLAGWFAAPVGIALCAIAAVNGVMSLRRFWRADHTQRWTYSLFIAIVFVILTISTITELGRLGVTS